MFKSLTQFLRQRPTRFRTRSESRDNQTDIRRLKSVESAIQEALKHAEREKSGLTERAEIARACVSGLIGSNVDEYRERDEKTESLLTESERELVTAANRINQLTAQISLFKRLLEVLNVAS